MRDISEIWIIASNGITIFNQQKESNVDAVLMGGFFSAIENFISEIGEKELKSLVLGNSKIIIYHGKKDLLFISRSAQKVKEKNVIKHLRLVESKFMEMFGEVIDVWDGNTDIFENFGNAI